MDVSGVIASPAGRSNRKYRRMGLLRRLRAPRNDLELSIYETGSSKYERNFIKIISSCQVSSKAP